MPVLVATFRKLLNEAESGLEAHLHSIGFSPSDTAVRWMASGFVHALDVEEVLLLWDRVIGFDSLIVLSVAAAGIFAWRGHLLRNSRSALEAFSALQHLNEVRTIPLLQSIIFLCGGRATVGKSKDAYDNLYTS